MRDIMDVDPKLQTNRVADLGGTVRPSSKYKAIGLLVIITAAGLTAYMTPMATSAIPIVMGVGGYDIKSLVKQSWLVSVVFGVFYVLYVMTVLPCF